MRQLRLCSRICSSQSEMSTLCSGGEAAEPGISIRQQYPFRSQKRAKHAGAIACTTAGHPCAFILSRYLQRCACTLSRYLQRCAFILSRYLQRCACILSRYLQRCAFILSRYLQRCACILSRYLQRCADFPHVLAPMLELVSSISAKEQVRCIGSCLLRACAEHERELELEQCSRNRVYTQIDRVFAVEYTDKTDCQYQRVTGIFIPGTDFFSMTAGESMQQRSRLPQCRKVDNGKGRGLHTCAHLQVAQTRPQYCSSGLPCKSTASALHACRCLMHRRQRQGRALP
jgi:hypothetical protein